MLLLSRIQMFAIMYMNIRYHRNARKTFKATPITHSLHGRKQTKGLDDNLSWDEMFNEGNLDLRCT